MAIAFATKEEVEELERRIKDLEDNAHCPDPPNGCGNCIHKKVCYRHRQLQYGYCTEWSKE